MTLLDEETMEVFFFTEERVEKLPMVGGYSSFFSLDFAFYMSGEELNLGYGLFLSTLGVKYNAGSYFCVFFFMNCSGYSLSFWL